MIDIKKDKEREVMRYGEREKDRWRERVLYSLIYP